MTIRKIDPDEAVTINGVQVTGRQLAEARQELSHRGVHNPHWVELSQHDQDMAALSAGGWLRALVDLVPTAGDASGYTCDECGDQADYWDDEGTPRCERCKAHQQATSTAPAGEQCPRCTSPYRDRRFVMPALDGTGHYGAAPCDSEWHTHACDDCTTTAPNSEGA
jgi:hypothetical protein